MRRLLALVCLLAPLVVGAAQHTITSPDGTLTLTVSLREGQLFYAVQCDNQTVVEPSRLGLRSNNGDYSDHLSLCNWQEGRIDKQYTLSRAKVSSSHYVANQLLVELKNAKGRLFSVEFRLDNHNLAFRYLLPKDGEEASIRILEELTAFRFPDFTTTFLTPQSDPMVGWKRSKPSYEEEYEADAPMHQPSQFGRGYTFPALFHVGERGWVLVSETDVDSRYCGSRLSDYSIEKGYQIAFPMVEENNGNGTSEPAMALPAETPWRTLTLGRDLKPIVETTIPWDLVEERYAPSIPYRMGRSTWSWIIWQDPSMNFEDQCRYIDLAEAMGYEYILIDAGWDSEIGYERMPELFAYARQRGVEPFLWYASSGYWNDITQSPVNRMDNPIRRKAEMRWMREQGVRGIKVDFWGGDKQETMRLYEAVLSDANDYGLMVIFHGCTLPRGWERMYPNFVGSEAVLASENLVFGQHHCDREAFKATLHPFIRNTVASMEFGGVILNKRLNRTNNGGSTRRTGDVFQLATAILFQNPIQNFALTPNNLEDTPDFCIDFMREVPTTWDEVRLLDGYPGRYVVLARRHGSTWWIGGVNATTEELTLQLELPEEITTATLYRDDATLQPTRSQTRIKHHRLPITLTPNGGMVLIERETK